MSSYRNIIIIKFLLIDSNVSSDSEVYHGARWHEIGLCVHRRGRGYDAHSILSYNYPVLNYPAHNQGEQRILCRKK